VARTLIPAESVQATNEWVKHQAGYRKQPNDARVENEDNRKLLGAIWSLIGNGLLIPRIVPYTGKDHPNIIDLLTLTERGERLVAKGVEHPLHPHFISTFKTHAPTASDYVVSYIEDSVTCLEAGAVRPALMMAGVANEETVRVAHAALAHQNKLQAATGMPRMRDLLSAIESVVNVFAPPGSSAAVKEQQHRLKGALRASEFVRAERNAVAHPGHKFSDGPQVESMLMLMWNFLPFFWESLVAPAVVAGFTVPAP
jgi:hypothetical protein